jgi:hypothetical protein
MGQKALGQNLSAVQNLLAYEPISWTKTTLGGANRCSSIGKSKVKQRKIILIENFLLCIRVTPL